MLIADIEAISKLPARRHIPRPLLRRSGNRKAKLLSLSLAARVRSRERIEIGS